MRAAVHHGPLDVRIEDEPEPEAGPGQVKIEVAHNGLCGSDLHEYLERPQFIPTSDGLGAAGAFDAAGAEGSVTGIIPALAPRGKVVVVAIHEQELERFNPTALLRQETEIVGSLTYDDDDFRAVIGAMADGHCSTDGWVGHAPLDDLPAAFDDLRAGRAIKVLIDL